MRVLVTHFAGASEHCPIFKGRKYRWLRRAERSTRCVPHAVRGEMRTYGMTSEDDRTLHSARPGGDCCPEQTSGSHHVLCRGLDPITGSHHVSYFRSVPSHQISSRVVVPGASGNEISGRVPHSRGNRRRSLCAWHFRPEPGLESSSRIVPSINTKARVSSLLRLQSTSRRRASSLLRARWLPANEHSSHAALAAVAGL